MCLSEICEGIHTDVVNGATVWCDYRGPEKGKDVIHQLKVSLEDLYNGATRKLSLKKKVICVKCEGIQLVDKNVCVH